MFLLVFVPFASLVPCGSGVFFFFSAKECRRTADPSNENNERKEKGDYLRLGGTLDAELSKTPNPNCQLPVAWWAF